jgi:hypothetical protein
MFSEIHCYVNTVEPLRTVFFPPSGEKSQRYFKAGNILFSTDVELKSVALYQRHYSASAVSLS